MGILKKIEEGKRFIGLEFSQMGVNEIYYKRMDTGDEISSRYFERPDETHPANAVIVDDERREIYADFEKAERDKNMGGMSWNNHSLVH